MAIKTSGAINFQDIVNEFGGANPAKLSEYYRGGSLVPNTNANSKIATSPGALKLSQFYGARKEIQIKLNMQGAGGAGGNGMADNVGSGNNAAGDATVFKISGGGAIATVNGGGGGGHGNRNSITGGQGGASDFGAGGGGGSPNAAGSRPAWGHWGAGGGGGGGDDGSTSYLNLYGSDAAGAAGSGGSKGIRRGFNLNVDVEVTYELVVGGGGNPTNYGNYKGGSGAPGYAEFTTSIDNFVTTYKATPGVAGGSAFRADWITSTTYYLRIARNGDVYFLPFPPAP